MLKLTEVTINKVHYLSAFRANQMMMMFRGSPQQIAAATTFSMNLADKSNLSEHIECAVDSDPSDAGILLVHLFIYRRRREMLMTEGDGVYYLAPLWGELIPSMP